MAHVACWRDMLRLTSPSRRLSLLAPTLGPIVAAFALAHCGGGSSGGNNGSDATADVSTDTGSKGDSTAMGDSNSGQGDSSSDAQTTETSTGVDASDGGAMVDASDAGPDVDTRIPCDAGTACGDAMACCSNFCVNVHRDPQNCGACGNACGAAQFCTGTKCDNAVFPNLCANPSITVVDDPWAVPDNEAGAVIAQGIASACPDAGIVISIIPQTAADASVLVQGDAGWRPNTGAGTTMVAGGSYAFQESVLYMDQHKLTPVYLTNDGTTAHFYETATGNPLISPLDSTLTAQHDYFALELAVEPQSSTLLLVGEGILGPGTAAAGYYGSQVVMPNLATYTGTWYIYEWTVTNNDMIPNAGDTFTLVTSG